MHKSKVATKRQVPFPDPNRTDTREPALFWLFGLFVFFPSFENAMIVKFTLLDVMFECLNE
jgi:hypothetical protein